MVGGRVQRCPELPKGGEAVAAARQLSNETLRISSRFPNHELTYIFRPPALSSIANMTIVDPSHPKAQMAFSVEGDPSTDDSDELPSYDAPSTSGSTFNEPLLSNVNSSSNPYGPLASGSASYAAVASSAPASAPFEPESIADLNPEMRKKLANDARDRGLHIDDYGFGAEPPVAELPSFEETDVGDRPTYSMDRNGNIVT